MLLWSSSPLWVIYSSFSLSALVFLSCFSQALCSELAGLPIVWTLGVCILLDCSTGFGGSPLSTAVEVQGTWQPPLRSEVTVSSVKPSGDPQRYAYFTLCPHPGDSLFGRELPASQGWAWQSQEGKAREQGRSLCCRCGEPREVGRCVTLQRKEGYWRETLNSFCLLRFVTLKTQQMHHALFT